ncbi:MAG: bi-domain-containing oxidoreductase [Candidatus Edwardsbacteria bacterium]|nr:bi-domain-containing oxidoreductase [Candidatus Edwardsbacteria bacterium]
MKQILMRKGRIAVTDVPAPTAGTGEVLVRVAYSCISSGTETAGLRNARLSLAQRVLHQPQSIRSAVRLVREQGITAAVRTVRGMLGATVPLGYSAAGTVVASGSGVTDLGPGDCVACAGAGSANHAEFIVVLRQLAVKVPKGLGLDSAATVTLGAIALQGLRRAELRIGEQAVVIGLGLLGQLTVQLLKASGCRVIGLDIDTRRIDRALKLGMEHGLDPRRTDVADTVRRLCGGQGADAVLLTAATASSGPINQAMELCRKRGRVVIIGAVGMDLKRDEFYAKELDLLISTAYGPGRYDPSYEQGGIDYPYAYVRWTMNRNMAAYLELLTGGTVPVRALIERIYPVEQAPQAYRDLERAAEPPLAVLLSYCGDGEPDHTRIGAVRAVTGAVNVAVVGLGRFATAVHLPNLAKLSGRFAVHALMDRSGVKAQQLADQYNARYCTTDYQWILDDPDVHLMMICTRHDSHATLALQALQVGKNVFLEKPLATTLDDLERIERFYASGPGPRPLLMVGFNRRFSPMAVEIARLTRQRTGPLFMIFRMNAGQLPPEHWAHRDGGRIVGEACHAVDLMNFLAGAAIRSVSSESLTAPDGQLTLRDCRAITLKYDDGSIGTIDYLSIGSGQLAKEYFEVHFDGRTIVLDDFKLLKGYGIAVGAAAGKGHYQELVRLHQTLSGELPEWPIELWDMAQTTRAILQSA